MSDKIFADGVFFKRHERAPDFVVGNLSMKLEDFARFANQNKKEGWLNLQIKQSKGGKYYVELDTFEPKNQGSSAPADNDDTIPF